MLKSVLLPESIKSIGACAFAFCSNLEAVEFEEPSSLRKLNGRCFAFTKLMTISLPTGCEMFSPSTFTRCTVEVRSEEVEVVGNYLVMKSDGRVIGFSAFGACQISGKCNKLSPKCCETCEADEVKFEARYQLAIFLDMCFAQCVLK
jgi:hypothetical protein